MATSEPHWTRVHRAIRALPDGEGPFRGTLVADGEKTVVAVPLAQLEGWEGWPFAGSAHIAAPADIALLDSGFHALMPWCTLELRTLLARRALAEDPLSAGEICTLTASVLRGLAELGEALTGAQGTWWLTDDARPVFVLGPGPEAGEAARGIFGELAETAADRRLGRMLAQLAEAAQRPRTLAREAERWETELLESAAAAPLRVDVFAPAASRLLPQAALREELSPAASAIRELRSASTARGARSRTLARAAVATQAEPRLTAPSRTPRPRPGARRDEGLGNAPAWSMRERLGERLDRVRELVRSRGGASRPRKLLVAGGIGVAVLLAGILWPAEEPAEIAIPIETTPPVEPEPEDAEPFSPISEPDHHIVALQGLIGLARECLGRGDDLCPEVFASKGDEGMLLRLTLPAGEPELADDYGDIAVLRMAGAPGELIVVLERDEEHWRIRDLYELGS